MNEKVLILGGTYFVGYQIVQYLLKDNFDVTILNRGTKKEIHGKSVKEIYCDRNDLKKLKILLEKETFDYVIDVSGLNKKDLIHSYEVLKNHKLKSYVFISSSAVYAESNVFPISEDFPIGFNSHWGDYGINKIESEEFLFEKYKNENFPAITIRPPYIYGESNYVYRESFIFDLLDLNEDVVVPNKGETLIHFIHIEDLYYTIKALMTNSDCVGEAYNVGDSYGYTFRGWINQCAKALGRTVNIIPFNYKENGYEPRDFFPFRDYPYFLDISKVSKIYKPKIKFETGLKRTYCWYKNNKDSVHKKDIYFENYMKIKGENI